MKQHAEFSVSGPRASAAQGAAVLATLFYGQVPVWARMAFFHGVDGIAVVLARTSFIALLLGLVVWRGAGQWRALAPVKFWLVLQALATLAVSTGLILSVQFIAASLAVIIFFTAPLLVLLAAPLAEGQPLSPRQMGLGLLGFGGLALALGPSWQGLDARGLGLAAMAACGYAMQFVSGRKLANHLPPLSLAWLVHMLILPVVAVLFWLLPKAASAPMDKLGVAALLAVCAVYLLGYALQMVSLAKAEASQVVMIFNLKPVVTMLAAALVLGETLALRQYAGFAAVLLAVGLASLSRGTPKSV